MNDHRSPLTTGGTAHGSRMRARVSRDSQIRSSSTTSAMATAITTSSATEAATKTTSVTHGIVNAGYEIALPIISASTTPSGIASVAPRSAVMMLSWRIIRRTCRLVIPTARSMPSSRVRSNTVRMSVFTIPKRLMMIESESST